MAPGPPSQANTHTTAAAAATTSSREIAESISPSDEPLDPPPDSTVIRLGFDGSLPYDFVATTALSSSQIFLFVPLGLAYGLEIPVNEIRPMFIKPDNKYKAGYSTTTVQLYIPSKSKHAVSPLLHNRNSRLYNNPDPSVRAIISMLDSSYPLGVSDSGTSSGSTKYNANGGVGGGDDGDDENGNGGSSGGGDGTGSNSSSKAHPSSVGIGVGAVGGAAVYGAGMVWVARRYRKKRQQHKRSSSAASQMREAPESQPAFLTGGRMSRGSNNSRRTNRTQMISAPVTVENSLGWN